MIIFFLRQAKARCKRKCRNWQTSKTKDLVAIAVVWVQVPSSAFFIPKNKVYIWGGTYLLVEILNKVWKTIKLNLYIYLNDKHPKRCFFVMHNELNTFSFLLAKKMKVFGECIITEKERSGFENWRILWIWVKR